jgi:hypothetical protein
LLWRPATRGGSGQDLLEPAPVTLANIFSAMPIDTGFRFRIFTNLHGTGRSKYFNE